jgi:hypothetical protein
VATTTVYANQGFPDTYKKSLGTLNSIETSKLNVYLKNYGKTTNVNTLRRTFNMIRSRLSLKMFMNIEVPDTFRITLMETLETRSPKDKLIHRECLSPWCNYYQSSVGINEVIRGNRRLGTLHSFNSLFICSGCNIVFGHDENDMWREVNEHIELGYALSVS